MVGSLEGCNVLITGASMGIGRAITLHLARESANLVLFARSADKLNQVASEAKKFAPRQIKVHVEAVDLTSPPQLDAAVKSVTQAVGHIDVLINNAGLALGAPNVFPKLSVQDVMTMISTNITGYMLTAHAVLNSGMLERKRGTILNITSTTALEVPPFPGECVYHTSKAAQEGFTNSLRSELVGTNIKVMALRPGVVATNFHEQRVGYDKDSYNQFMDGFEPLVADDVAEQVVWVLKQKERLAIKALDVVPSAQRMLYVLDKEWNRRNGVEAHKMGDEISQGTRPQS